jgi:hypothetical protein
VPQEGTISRALEIGAAAAYFPVAVAGWFGAFRAADFLGGPLRGDLDEAQRIRRDEEIPDSPSRS